MWTKWMRLIFQWKIIYFLHYKDSGPVKPEGFSIKLWMLFQMYDVLMYDLIFTLNIIHALNYEYNGYIYK